MRKARPRISSNVVSRSLLNYLLYLIDNLDIIAVHDPLGKDNAKKKDDKKRRVFSMLLSFYDYLLSPERYLKLSEGEREAIGKSQ